MTLEIQNLSFAYSKKQVLHDISVEGFKPGELTALIGPNATGKSTFFKCVSGVLKTTGATIKVGGLDISQTGMQAWNRNVCYMPQSFTSNAALTVFDVVLLARKHMHGWRVGDDDLNVVAETLHMLKVDHLSETFVGDLSGGQQQMVSIAQAVVRAPSLFLLDEPTSALDLRHQLEIMKIIKDVTQSRKIVSIVALHDLNLAARFADHVVLMREGKIISSGPPREILASPELAETYGVTIDIHETNEGVLTVAASL